MNAFASDLLNIVREMDAEATTRVNGIHAGLCDYAVHVGSNPKRYEVAWYRGIVGHLKERGYDARADQDYPDGSGRECDVVVTLKDARSLWLEVKGAWKQWFSSKSLRVTRNDLCRSYLLGDLAPGLARDHSAAQDIKKLEDLQGYADYAALLLIGFDGEAAKMDADVDQLEQLGHFTERGWHTVGPRTWPDVNQQMCRRACWVWWKALRKNP